MRTRSGIEHRASSIEHRASNIPHPARSLAFTLLELLTVIAIMGLLAALALPTLRGLKPNAKVAATRQLLDAVGRARQLALAERTVVYMVFVPTNFWTDPAYGAGWTLNDWAAVKNLYDKQMVAYAYVSLRSVGDQPGAHTPRYLSSWKTLPEGAYISPQKFALASPTPVLNFTNGAGVVTYRVFGFSYTNALPFPLETTVQASPARPYISLPYIAFDGMGRLVSGLSGQPELIPVTEGSVSFPQTGPPQSPQINERPPGNTIQNFSLVWIDRLTGRAHVEHRTVQ